MKIQPAKMESVPVPAKAKPKAPADAAVSDAQTDQLQLKTGRNERMKQALMREPDVRPEVVERAKKLAADPNYPSSDILAKIAEKFIADAKNSK
jgi:hypothetical protein